MSNLTKRVMHQLPESQRPVRLVAVVLFLLALGAGERPTTAQAHPFYSEALRVGSVAYEAGDFATAAERLRLASFGMLDQPPLLAETLVRLALSQAELAQRDEFLATFDRINLLGERFDAYSSSALPAALRTRFEERAIAWVPEPVLARSRAFAQLHRRQTLERLATLLPAARTTALERIVADSPDDLGWQLMLATARIESGAGGDAISALEGVFTAGTGDGHAGCLLGRAYLQSGRCEQLLTAQSETLSYCDIRRLPTPELEQYLDCLTLAGRWPDAASVVVSLAAERRTSRPFSRWEKRLAKELEPGFEAAPLPPFELAASAPAPAASGPPQSVASQPVASRPEPAAAQEPPSAELEALRRQSNAARSVEELQQVAAAAQALRSRFPASVEPLYIAGEAAYRASEWQRATEYLRAAGDPPDDRPELLFYLSVALHESGDREAAAEVLRRALPNLERTPIVERYRHEILE